MPENSRMIVAVKFTVLLQNVKKRINDLETLSIFRKIDGITAHIKICSTIARNVMQGMIKK